MITEIESHRHKLFPQTFLSLLTWSLSLQISRMDPHKWYGETSGSQ